MPLGPGIRYRVKRTSKGNVRLAFRGNRVVEAKNMKTGKLHAALSKHIRDKKFGKPKGKSTKKY